MNKKKKSNTRLFIEDYVVLVMFFLAAIAFFSLLQMMYEP